MLRAERTKLAANGGGPSDKTTRNPEKKITVEIFSRNRLMREYLSAAIKGDVDVTSSIAASGYPRIHNPPEIVLVEHQDANCTSVAQITRNVPTAKLILLSGDADELNVAECIRLGFVGFILKDAGLDDVLNTIREVAKGRSAVPAEITKRLCRQLYEERQTSLYCGTTGTSLTVRERQILGLVVEGLTNKEVAQRLNVATHTVKSHVHNLLQKLNARKRIDLVNYSLRDRGDRVLQQQLEN